MSAQTPSFHVSYLHATSVPLDRIANPRFASFHEDPSAYRNLVLESEGTRKPLFVKSVGRLRSACNPISLSSGGATRLPPMPDPLWSRMEALYHAAPVVEGKLPYLPSLPLASDVLPSNQRTYQLDFAGCSGGLSKLSPKNCRLSASLYYFPIGCAVTRIGLFAMSPDSPLDARDVVALTKNASSVRLTVRWKSGGKGRKRRSFQGSLLDYSQLLEQRFLRGLCGEGQRPNTIGTYSFNDFSGLIPSLDLNRDSELVFQTIQSALTNQPAVLPANVAYSLPSSSGAGVLTGATILGDRAGFLWTPPQVDERWRVQYRRVVRNMTTLVLAQLSLPGLLMGLEQAGWSEQIRSKTFFATLKRGLFPPSLIWPLTIRHYATIQACFETDDLRTPLFRKIRESLDRLGNIAAIPGKTDRMLAELERETQAAGKSFGATVSRAVSAVKGLLT